MVAIALYRGNLHRVPNTPPRRWPIPSRSISSRQFRSLRRRRSIALSRIADVTEPQAVDESNLKVEVVEEQIVEEKRDKMEKEEKKKEMCDVKDESGKMDNTGEELDPPVKEEITTTEKEERKRELETKLESLNQRKHHLVQMLKQILNAEEEIKRRNTQPTQGPTTETQSTQGPIIENGPIVDNGPGLKRLKVDVNLGNEVCNETDPGSSQSAPNRPVWPMQSPSPSSLNRSPFVHNQRGQIGHASSLPPLLPLPSSLSPAASSAGMSVFRDSRFSGGPN